MKVKSILELVTAGMIIAAFPFSSQALQSFGTAFDGSKPFELEDLPPGRAKQEIDSLPLEVQLRAMDWLNSFSFHQHDLDFIHIDNDGGVFYVDPAFNEYAGESTTSETSGVIETATDIFNLHSKPGSNNILFIDFDGHEITGTAWNSGGESTYYASAFNTEGDDATFTDTERSEIQQIWHRIAEDFSPFDVDVTTAEPATFTSTTGHVLITRDTDTTGTPMPYQYAGGVAYVGVWGRSDYYYYSPALVYYDNLGAGHPPYVAEASSHEIGHNVSLSHDGTSTSGYYSGHGSGYVSWAPVMGVGYYKNITQWSQGEYNDATQFQDDISIITGHMERRPDDHGDTLTSASELYLTNSALIEVSNPETDPDNLYPENKGIIEDRNDVDTFTFLTGDGVVDISATPAWDAYYRETRRGANLDIELSLHDGSVVIATSDPIDDTDARIIVDLSAGRYYLEVTGVGNSDSPYSDYGSLGQYFLSGTVPSGANEDSAPYAPTNLVANAVSSSAIGLIWNDNSPNEDGFRVERSPDGVTSWMTIASNIPANSQSYFDTGLAQETTYHYRINAFNTVGTSAYSNETSATTQAPLPTTPAIPTAESATNNGNGSATFSWTDNSNNEDGFEVQREKAHKKRAGVWTGTTLVGSVSEDATSITDSSGSGTFRYRVRAFNSGGASDWSLWKVVAVTDSSGGGGGNGGGGGKCKPKKDC